MMPSLVLASTSPFRKMLMQNAGLAFDALPASIDERALEEGFATDLSPEGVALALAEAKAASVSPQRPGALVIGSDQTMSLGTRRYHKPVSLDEARAHIESLSGRTHQLNSAFAIVQDGVTVASHVSSARLSVRDLSSRFIDGYIERNGAHLLTSVGAYQLEGEGIQLFDAIEGDYFTILGLPMLPLLQHLRRLGALHA